MTITAKDVEGHDAALDLMIRHREIYAGQLMEAIADNAGFSSWCAEEHQRLMQAKRDNDALLTLLAGKKSTAEPISQGATATKLPGVPARLRDMNQTKDRPEEPWFMERARDAGVKDLEAMEVPSYEDGTKMPNDPTDPMYKHALAWKAFLPGVWSSLVWDAYKGNHAYYFPGGDVRYHEERAVQIRDHG